MFDMLLIVAIYLIDSILSGIYSQGFLKEKYGKKVVLAVWGIAYFLIQIVVYEILDARFPVGEVTGIILNVCVLLFMQFLFFEKDMQKQFFVVFSFVAGKEIVKYIVSVFSIASNGLINKILDYFVAKEIIDTLEKTHIWINIFNETVINPPAELGRLTNAGGGEQSTKIKNSAV